MFENQNTKYYLLIAIIAFLFVFCSVVSIAGSSVEDNQAVTAAVGTSGIGITSDPVTTSAPGTVSGTNAPATTPATTTADDEPTGPVTPKNIKICVDAGHGWADGGAVSPYTDPDGKMITESDINLAISKELEKALIARGYKVVMIRENDTDIGPAGIAADNICNVNRRVEWINSQKDLSLVISIHCDTFEGPVSASGTRIYFQNTVHPEIATLAQFIADHLANDGVAGKYPLTYPDAGSKFLPLKASKTQSILVECGFITDEGDTNNLIDPSYQKNFAKAVAKAIDEFFQQ